MLTSVEQKAAQIGRSDGRSPYLRIALVIDFESAQHWDEVVVRLNLVERQCTFFAGSGYGADGTVTWAGRVNTGSWRRAAQKEFSGYDAVVFVRHAAVDANEIDFALQSLTTSGTPVHLTIPGLNELQTTNFAALIAVDTNAFAESPKPPIMHRIYPWAVAKLPVSVKQPIKTAILKLGMGRAIGDLLPGTAPPDWLQAGGDPARITNTNSAASVLRAEGLMAESCSFSLGHRELQQRVFVDAVAALRPYPRTINIVLSNQCNLECVMCPFHSPLFRDARQNDYFDDKKWISVKMIERLVSEVRRIKPDSEPISFHMGELDEPALHPKLAEIVKLLADIPNSIVHITSNGNIFNEKLARKVILAGVKSMQFSVDAQTSETYKKIRGGKLQKVQENVKRFLRLRTELGKDVYVNLCIIDQEGAHEEIDSFKVYWREAGASSVSIYRLFKPAESNAAKWVVPSKYFEEKVRTPCTAVWDQMFLYPDGKTSLCCTTLIRVPQDGVISYGNLLHSSLKDIWLGQKYQKVRRDLIDNKLSDHPYCADCDNWSSSYQYMKMEPDGTKVIYGESMAYHFFPENQ